MDLWPRTVYEKITKYPKQLVVTIYVGTCASRIRQTNGATSIYARLVDDSETYFENESLFTFVYLRTEFLDYMKVFFNFQKHHQHTTHTAAKGMGRHSRDEVNRMGKDDIRAIVDYLGDKKVSI